MHDDPRPSSTPAEPPPADADASGRLRLLARLRARYELLEDHVVVADHRFDFTRVTDPKVVLDRVIEAEGRGEPARMPYWAELWESAQAVGEWILADAAARGGGRAVLDLGCGMGFAGMVAAAAGHRVLLADLEPDALLFAELNAWPWRRQVRVRRLNWQSDRLDEKFDLILGADVLYERGQREHLEPFWRQHLAAAGRVVLGEPGRQTGDEFPDWIRSRGWTLESSTRRVEAAGKTIRLFVLSR